ncbi:unnamed protein product [Candida verbasci]|uniref:candidapepsin n=1 Tax=Candida verbasci TaxID=1227364 RepID=A0A9W4TZI3_9ASCO|nr:unnamed protein product [Candida verbasci]
MLFKYLSAAFLAVAQGAIIKRDSPKTLKLDFHVAVNGTANGITKRDSVDYDLQNIQTEYLIELTVGSDYQHFSVALDTGSSDLWIPTPDAVCTNDICLAYGSFDPRTSTSYTDLNTVIKDYYVDGTFAFGDYGKDDVHLPGGNTLNQFQFGSMNNISGNVHGLLGIDFPIFESTSYQSGEIYNNFPMALKAQNIIDQVSYSLYLNQLDAETGSIIFSGIDKAKYTGDLVVLNISTNDVSVKTNDLVLNGQSLNFQDDIILDSGSTNINFWDKNIVDQIYQELNSNSNGLAPCDQPSDKFLTFKFDGLEVDIPYSDLVRPSNQAGKCWVGVGYYGGVKENLVGDFFLRKVYVAYNLESRKIGLANAKYTDEEDIVDFWF